MIARIKLNFSDACLSLGKDPGENSVLAVPDEGFGFNVNKLHRTFNDELKDLQLERSPNAHNSNSPKTTNAGKLSRRPIASRIYFRSSSTAQSYSTLTNSPMRYSASLGVP